jgi:hypothetical protein
VEACVREEMLLSVRPQPEPHAPVAVLALGGFVSPWIHPTPAIYDPETYYWENPEEHT